MYVIMAAIIESEWVLTKCLLVKMKDATLIRMGAPV